MAIDSNLFLIKYARGLWLVKSKALDERRNDQVSSRSFERSLGLFGEVVENCEVLHDYTKGLMSFCSL